MSEIRVKVGQQNAIKILSSSIAKPQPLADAATDIDTTNRADRTFLMYDAASGKYIHVDAFQIVDLSDSVDDDSMDAGTF